MQPCLLPHSGDWRLVALGNMVENAKKGTRDAMTGAHLGGRGACRRRGSAAIAATRGVGGRRSHGDGRHHVDF